jgi:uncharacterized membrane protein required for colicin V production
MNWLLILTVLIVAGYIVWGYSKGLVRVVYSMLAWILVLVIVALATPKVADWMAQNTAIDEWIQENVEQRMHEFVEGSSDGQALFNERDADENTVTGDDAEEKTKKNSSEQINAQEKNLGGNTAKKDTSEKSEEQEVTEDLEEELQIGNLEELGIRIPDQLAAQWFKTQNAADSLLDSTGVYDVLSKNVTDMAMRALAFLIVFVITQLVFWTVSRSLGVVNKLPLIGKVNRTLGGVAGMLKGMCCVWLVFAVIAVAGATEIARTLSALIYNSAILTWIYENNPLLSILMTFL